MYAAQARLRKQRAEIFKKNRPGQRPQAVDRIGARSRLTTISCMAGTHARKPWWIGKFFNPESQMRAHALDSAGILDYSKQGAIGAVGRTPP
jgi:hypothetical protein